MSNDHDPDDPNDPHGAHGSSGAGTDSIPSHVEEDEPSHADSHGHSASSPQSGGHEHPEPLDPEPIANPWLMDRIAQALTDANAASRHREALRNFESELEDLDLAARFARRMIAGDPDALNRFANWLETEHIRSPVSTGRSYSSENSQLELREVVQSREAGNELNTVPLMDILIATAARAHAMKRSADEATRRVLPRLIQVGESILSLSRVVDSFDRGVVTLGSLLDLLRTLDRRVVPSSLPPGFPPPGPKIPPIDPRLICLGEIARIAARPSGSLAQAIEELRPHEQTDRIASVDPVMACVGETLTLRAHASNPFDVTAIASLDVYFAPCSVRGEILSIAPLQVTVRVPARAQSGLVYFAAKQDVATVTKINAIGAREFGGILMMCFGIAPPSHLGLVHIVLGKPMQLCWDSLAPVSGGNGVIVHRRPFINSFLAYDASGQVIPSPVSIEACVPLTVDWDISSNQPLIAVELHTSTSLIAANLPAKGRYVVPFRTDTALRLEAENACGRASSSIQVSVSRKVTLPPIVRVAAGSSGPLGIRVSCESTSPVSVQLDSTNPTRVAVPQQQTIAAHSSWTTAQVQGLAVGSPATRAAVVTARAPGHDPASVDVWVTSTTGQWSTVLGGPGASGLPAIGTIGVHAALLRSGKVLLWSYDETDWSNIDKANSSLWDPLTNRVTDIPAKRNQFCSGHSFLADGRLLVCGGQSLSQTVGQVVLGTVGWPWATYGGSDHDLHTFQPVTETWSRHADMAGARWYPTVVTLPDGRALIVAGFWSHRHSIVNEDFEIFDPTTNTLTSPTKFLPDICLYPFVHVLPGGSVFVHSRNRTRLFIPDATSSPLGRTLSPEVYFTKTSSTRNYPGAGTSVVLPLRPSDGMRAQVLIAGGTSAASNPSSTTPATASAQRFIFDGGRGTARQSGWMNAGTLSSARFMCDSVLLPDGNVLVVGGVARGTADSCAGPVMTAELYDPRTGFWQTVGSMSVPRYYHQTALLLPDGRVMVAGSTGGGFSPGFGGGNINEYRVEVFAPPYLFRGPRPVLRYVPTSMSWGSLQTIYVADEAQIREIVILRAGSVTHQVNSDQRFVQLEILERRGEQIVVRMPPDGSFAPPGWYLCFAVDWDFVPSIGQFTRMG